MPAQVGLPVQQGSRLELRFKLLEKFGLGHIHLGNTGQPTSRKIPLPAERRSQRFELLAGQLMKQLVRISLVDSRQRSFCQRCFDLHHGPCVGPGRIGTIAEHFEHLLDVELILLAGFRRLGIGLNVVIAIGQTESTAGGLGLPDRDYYVKTDAKSTETREKYQLHVQKMFEMLGDSPDTARANAGTVMEIETALAKASLTRVDKRDPYKLFHKLTRKQLETLTPSFRWERYLAAGGLSRISEVNVTEPEFFKQLEAELKSRTLLDWKTYLRWHVAHARAPYLSTPFVAANFEFYAKYLRGVTVLQPRWKRCVQFVDRDLGEALGRVFVEKTFGPDVKQRALAMTKEIQNAMEVDIKELP